MNEMLLMVLHEIAQMSDEELHTALEEARSSDVYLALQDMLDCLKKIV